MKLNRGHKEIRIVDVSVERLMATLMELHEIGAEFIDLVLTPGDMQDEIGIVIKSREQLQEKDDKLNQEIINKLLE